MPHIEILGTGRLDERDSAYPMAVQLPGGDILCSFCVGDGPRATGGSDWAQSKDGGCTWRHGGTILPVDRTHFTGNHLKLSISADGRTIYAYGSRHKRTPGQVFGEFFSEPVYCVSTNGGISWSKPKGAPIPREGNFEICHGILPLRSGRLLAPAATLPSHERLGEKVLAAISDDGGRTWPKCAIVFQDPDRRHGCFEHKLAEISSRIVMATAWTVTHPGIEDRPNSFTLSHDDGATWGPIQSTGIDGQTMTPIPLGGDRLLVLHNRRYGAQGIVMSLVTFNEKEWATHFEDFLYEAGKSRARPENLEDGAVELSLFEFGFPTAIPLADGTFLATFWNREKGRYGIRWTKLRVDW